jgi:hypothetical protein
VIAEHLPTISDADHRAALLERIAGFGMTGAPVGETATVPEGDDELPRIELPDLHKVLEDLQSVRCCVWDWGGHPHDEFSAADGKRLDELKGKLKSPRYLQELKDDGVKLDEVDEIIGNDIEEVGNWLVDLAAFIRDPDLVPAPEQPAKAKGGKQRAAKKTGGRAVAERGR